MTFRSSQVVCFAVGVGPLALGIFREILAGLQSAQTIEVKAKTDNKEARERLVKDAGYRTFPLRKEIVQMLVDHQAQQPQGYPYLFVTIARYGYIKNVLRPKGERTLTDSRLKVVNNFRRQFNRILRKAAIKNGTLHHFRRTAISRSFANGMSEHDVMVLAGPATFATTHEFYLAVADDLVYRARVATAHSLRQKLVHFGADAFRA